MMNEGEANLGSCTEVIGAEASVTHRAVPPTPGEALAWYCARTQPKHEHIAAANLRKNLALEVFSPRLRSDQMTFRGVLKKITESVFPGYIFVRCAIDAHIGQIRHTSGISSIVNFGGRIPNVPDDVIEDLRNCFGAEEVLEMRNEPSPGDDVTLAGGAFLGMQAVVLRSWPAKRRVQVLLEILGRPTPLEIDRRLLALHRDSIADCLPVLAAAPIG